METLIRFRLLVVRFSLLLVTITALLCYFLFGVVVAKGVLGGGIAATLAFWIMARSAQKFASSAPGQIKSSVYRGTFFRMLLYGVTLAWAYTLDKETLRGLMGAVGSLFLPRLVVIFFGMTGLDLRDEKKSDGKHR